MASLARRRRGLTLIEMMVAAGLAALVLVTAAPNFSRSQVSTKGVAESMAAALTEARQLAINKGSPVAVVIPSGDGAYPQASSYYLLEGEFPTISRVVDLSREHPGVHLLVGHWGLDTSKLSDPALVTTLTPPAGQTFESEFDPALWQMPRPKDYALIFSPSGRVFSNGLPHFDGAFHLVVCSGARSSSATPPGTPSTPNLSYFVPDELGRPVTVAINFLGQVSTTSGLMASAGGTVIRETVPNTSVAPPPAITPPVAAELVSEKVFPDPSQFQVPPGNDGRIAPDEPITLTAVAKGPGPMTCEWSAASGTLSQMGPQPMLWDPANANWIARIAWQPPPGAEDTEIEVTYTVTGGNKQATIGGMRFKVGSGGVDSTILTTGYGPAAPTGTPEVHIINLEGTGKRKVAKVSGFAARNPTLSPDGSSFIVYNMTAAAPIYGGRIEIYSRSGVQLASVPLPPGTLSVGPIFSWDPSGTRVAFPLHRTGFAAEDLYIIDANGQNLRKIYNGISVGTSWPIRWSPDGKRLCFSRSPGSPVTTLADGTDVKPLPSMRNGPFSPDGTRVSISSFPGVRTVKLDGTGLTSIPVPNVSHLREWAKDGNSALMQVAPGPAYQWCKLDGTPLSPRYSGTEGAQVSSNGKYMVMQPVGTSTTFISSVDGLKQNTLPIAGYYDLP